MTDDLTATLLELERTLGAGDGDTYRTHLTEDAVVVVPTGILSRADTAAAMDASAGWDAFDLEDPTVVRLGDDVARLTYVFAGRRGDSHYTAYVTSVYVQRDGRWWMASHQQTPTPDR